MLRNFDRGTRRFRAAAFLFFICFSLVFVLFGRGDRSGWILATVPSGDGDNSLLGYSFLYGDQAFMKENIPHVAQVALFCGSRDAYRASEFRQDFRLLRGVYSFLAALLAPISGVIPALLLANWLSWGLCAWSAWQLAREAFGSELASMFAAIFATSGIGMTAHIGDYSPHLLAFATYFLGIVLLARSRVYRELQPWRTHLALGFYFALACLTYNTGVMLVGVYLVTAARRNRFGPVLVAAVLGLSARPLWALALATIAPIPDVEAQYFLRSIRLWGELFESGVWHSTRTIAGWFSEYILFFDSPLVVLLGLFACIRIRAPGALRWLGWTSMGIPLLAALVFAPGADARGYLIYGGTIWLYVCLATQFAAALESDSTWLRRSALVTLILCLIMQVEWSAAHLLGNLGPLKTYFWGWAKGYQFVVHPRAMALSFTDHERTPLLFGGRGSLVDAGAIISRKVLVLERRQVLFLVAVAARAIFLVYALALVRTVALRRRVANWWMIGVSLVFLASCGLSALMLRESPAFFKVDEAVPLPSGKMLRYDIELGERFVEALLQQIASDDRILVFLKGRDEMSELAVDVRIAADPFVLRQVKTGIYELPTAAHAYFLERLQTHRRLSFIVRNDSNGDDGLLGWQRADLPNRAVSSDGGEPLRVLPAVELRVVRTDGSLKFVGF